MIQFVTTRLAEPDVQQRGCLLDGFPLVKSWAEALMSTELVTGSVHESFPVEFAGNLKRREFWAASLFEAQAAE